MDLKYAVELGRRSDQPCPCPKKFQQRAITLFRFVPNEASEENFVPRFDEISSKSKCSAYAISFFASIEQAQERYSSLADVHDDEGMTARDRYGDHIGEILLQPSDGVMDDPHSRTGHVGLHPSVRALFAHRIVKYTVCEYFDLGMSNVT